MTAMTTQERLLDVCKKLFAVVIAPDLFTEDKRQAILDEARKAMHAAQAESN
jgi:hypothetical protein